MHPAGFARREQIIIVPFHKYVLNLQVSHPLACSAITQQDEGMAGGKCNFCGGSAIISAKKDNKTIEPRARVISQLDTGTCTSLVHVHVRLRQATIL